MREVYRVLVPGGRACVNVANLGRKPYIPMNGLIAKAMIDLGFLMRGEIIWDKAATASTSLSSQKGHSSARRSRDARIRSQKMNFSNIQGQCGDSRLSLQKRLGILHRSQLSCLIV